MDPGFATILDNWFPDSSDCRVRKGYSQHVTGIGTKVESLMCYNKIDGTNTLFAAEATDFYNVTTAGALGAAVQSSLSNAQWYHTNFVNSSGTSYLCCFNGTDSPRYWDGSSWTTVTGVSSPAITGVTTTGLIYPFVHKRRMFIIEKDTLKLWYLPVDSVGGAANAFDLSGVADKGGYLVAGGAWTFDGGQGIDDYLVAITSEGQVIVYSGTNPATDYSLVGVYNIGEPLGRRCLHKYRGDLLVFLKSGLYPLSSALQSAQVDPESSLSFNIQPTFTSASIDYEDNFGWQVIHFPKGNMVIANIPVANTTGQHQYVMNTITGAWCRFKGIDAICFEICGGDIYFGADTYVGKFWNTEADDGDSISADLRHAFSYLGSRANIKEVKSSRPYILSNGSPAIGVGMNVDYKSESIGTTITLSGSQFGVWDTGTWDSAIWGGGLSFLGRWLTTPAVGTAIAPRVESNTSGIELRYSAIDILFESGTVIG